MARATGYHPASLRDARPAVIFVILFSLTVLWGHLFAAPLPIYIEDSHAGTFYWLAEHIDLDQPCTLLHFDAHSDASGIFDSDKIRAALRRVDSAETRQELLAQWRENGTIQCFNWIEPLMPAPIARVVWITNKPADQAKAIAQLDGHLEAAPRASGSFKNRFTVTDLAHLADHVARDEPVIATIDLDSFSGMTAEAQASEFARVWDFVMQQSNLRAITFAISRPFLKDEAEANSLLLLAINAARLLPTAQIEFEPFAVVRHDRSLRSREFESRGETAPAFDVARSLEALKSVLLVESSRLIVKHDAARWRDLLKTWQTESVGVRLELKDCDPSTDGAWRIGSEQTGRVELLAQPWTAKPARVEWSVLLPANTSCNVSRLGPDQVGFIANAAPRPQWIEKKLDCTDFSLSLGEIDSFFDPQLHCGSVRLRARAFFGDHVRETPAIEIRRRAGSGFRGAVTEQFGLPYLFGAGELAVDGETGAETNLGADCANFLVYAMRRQGTAVPWCDPKQLRSRLELIARDAEPGSVRIDPNVLASGLIVHLGSHVAAVLEDRPPLGILDGNDLVAHQLKGFPERLTLEELLGSRRRKTFDLFKVPAGDRAQSIVFGGDVMLGRSWAERIRNGVDPFDSLHDLLRNSSLTAANLECVLTQQEPRRRYAFAAPLEAAGLLHRAGFRALGVANNHALDFGPEELQRTARELRANGIETVGLASDDPRFFTLPKGARVAMLALTDLPGAGDAIASAADLAGVETSLSKAQLSGDLVLCMVHWGEENNPHPTERQRELARWLVQHGADAIAGAHPHCLQPLDFYHGKPIAYSLGNLVFDGAPTVKSWNEGALFQLYVSGSGKMEGQELIPIRLMDGLPVAQERAAP